MRTFRLTHIVDLPLYVGFADTERGRALTHGVSISAWPCWSKSGKLRPIFAALEAPVSVPTQTVVDPAMKANRTY